MRRITRLSALSAGIVLLLSAIAAPARATFHFWDIVEVYSNASGTIQFIELFTAANNQDESADSSRRITSNTNSFVFGVDLPTGNATANKSLLIGTVGYAALSGLPAPDFTIPNNFFSTSGDTLSILAGVSTVIDTLTFTGAQLPTDGVNSLNHANLDNTNTSNQATNSPKNLAGETGSVPEPGTVALLALGGTLILLRRRIA